MDELRFEAVGLARKLAQVLHEMEETGGTIPDLAYDGLSLIESSLTADKMADACCGKQFERFNADLSSYAAGYFPKPAAIMETLADCLNVFPGADEMFQDSPWLASSHSTWRDFVRIMDEHFRSNDNVYGSIIFLEKKHWLHLVHVMVNPNASYKEISDCFI